MFRLASDLFFLSLAAIVGGSFIALAYVALAF
jgi:hypothetical protein